MKKEDYRNFVKDYELWDQYLKSFDKENKSKIIVFHKEEKMSKILDLHNFTVNDGYKKTEDFLIKAKEHKIDKVVIITGKSGMIKKEFPFWMEKFKNNKIVQYAKDINGGSYEVKLYYEKKLSK